MISNVPALLINEYQQLADLEIIRANEAIQIVEELLKGNTDEADPEVLTRSEAAE